MEQVLLVIDGRHLGFNFNMENREEIKKAANLLKEASEVLSGISEASSISTSSSSGVLDRISQTVNRARGMMQASSRGGMFRRLGRNERLRASGGNTSAQGSKKEKKMESKALEYALLQAKEEDTEDDEDSLTKDMVLERGIVEIAEKDDEGAIRHKLVSSLEQKYPSLRVNDFSFVKVSQKKISTLNLAKGTQYNFNVVKRLAGQGLLYIRMKPEFQCLLENEEPCSDSELEKSSFAVDSDLDTQRKSHQDGTPVPAEACTTSAAVTCSAPQLPERKSSTPFDDPTEGCTDFFKNIIDTFPEDIVNPTEMLRYLQMKIGKGRDLEIRDEATPLTGIVNFITVDRDNILETTFQELESVKDPSITFDVQFFGERATDGGGPRKEWLRYCNRAIQQKYFQNGMKEHLASDYYYVGQIMAITLLQNGQPPRYLPEDIIEAVFSSAQQHSPCVRYLRKGLNSLGLAAFGRRFPLFIHLLRPTEIRLSGRMLIQLLEPRFSEVGCNALKYEKEVYARFIQYVREVESGRRVVCLEQILEFATCVSEVPLLGFGIDPHILFNVAELVPIKEEKVW